MLARIRPFSALCILPAAALLVGGCGNSTGSDGSGSHPNYAEALADSPAPLAALHKQANVLLPGGKGAFEKRIAQLRGYPVVANIWASWCGPCRAEFPMFQQLSARYGKKVAFVGIDGEDSNDAAATFLREAPVPYPSYTDPSKEILRSLGGYGGFPDTAYYNRKGRLLYLKQGQYHDSSQLEADIRRYALRGA